jgi:hypothetical protein
LDVAIALYLVVYNAPELCGGDSIDFIIGFYYNSLNGVGSNHYFIREAI